MYLSVLEEVTHGRDDAQQITNTIMNNTRHLSWTGDFKLVTPTIKSSPKFCLVSSHLQSQLIKLVPSFLSVVLKVISLFVSKFVYLAFCCFVS